MLRTIFVLSILIPGFFMALVNRFRALLLYLWFSFFRPQEWLWFDITSLRVSLALALLLIVPWLLTGVLPNLTHPLSIGAILFLLTGLVAQVNAVDQAWGWYWIQFLAVLITVTLLAVSLIKTPRDWARVLAVIAGSLAFYGTKAGVVAVVAGGAQFSAGLAGAFIDNNGYALAVVMIIPMLIAMAQNADLIFRGLLPQFSIRWMRRGLYLAVPLCAYTVICTFSRAGFLGLLGSMFAFVLLHPRRIQLIVAGLALSTLLFVIPLPKGYADRVASIASVSVDNPDEDSSEGRVHFWGIAIRLAEEYPIGVGMRNFSYHFSANDTTGGAYGHNRDVHSSHFQVLSEQGFLALFVWVFEFLYGFLVAWRVRMRSRTPGLEAGTARFFETMSTALIVSMIGFLIAGSFISEALNELTWITFGLLASLDLLSRKLCTPVPVRSSEPFGPRAVAPAR